MGVENGHCVDDYMHVRTSRDLIHWSEPITLTKDGKQFGNHYQAIVSPHADGDPAVIPDKQFTVMSCHNGTDVLLNDVTFE